ncbi:MAG TPA: hypothetical protein VFP37_09245 [Steroidobacteraceae bacterium]|nr:hypothetical protein [Steroidobacteraceae bacterium]
MDVKYLTGRAALLVAVALITSCGRTPPAPARAQADPGAGVDWVAKSVAFREGLEKDRDAVLRDVGRLEYDFQRRLVTFSGLEADLGGPEAADAALRALLGAAHSRVTQADYSWMRVADGAAPDVMAAVAMTTFEVALIALNFDDLAAQDPGKHSGEPGSNRIEMDLSREGVDYTSTQDVTVEGMSVKMQNKLKVNYCPDASGKIVVDLSTTSSLTRGGKGANTRIDVRVTRYVDDDARMEAMDTEQHVEAAVFGGGAGTFVDFSTASSTRADGANYSRVNRSSSRATDADAASANAVAAIVRLTAIVASEQTRDVWAKGGCVKLDVPATPAKRTGVTPGSSFELLAQPRSKVDGSSVGGTVRGELEGEARLDPAGSKVRADARFAYVAPDERGKRATLRFEARSRRGIANTEVSFDTDGASYRAEGGADEFHGSGVICDLGEQFFIEGSGVTVRFEPSSPAGGRYSYSGTMSGFQVFGHGEYTVNFRDDVAVSISAHGPGSVKTPSGLMTREGQEEYTLTPTGDAGCGVT